MINPPDHKACLAMLLKVERLLKATSKIREARVEAVESLEEINNYHITVDVLPIAGRAGTAVIWARDKGSCVDPSTERYWST